MRWSGFFRGKSGHTDRHDAGQGHREDAGTDGRTCRLFCLPAPGQPARLERRAAGTAGDRAVWFAAFCCESIAQGVALAREKAGSDGLVCALGSLYLAAEVRAQFEKE